MVEYIIEKSKKGGEGMDYIREVIDSDKLIGIFNIPEIFKHRTVEVLILPVEEKKSGIKKLRGSLKKYSDSSLINREKEGWKLAVKSKHGNS